MGLEIKQVNSGAAIEKRQPPAPAEAKNDSTIVDAEIKKEAPVSLSHALAQLGSNPEEVFNYIKNAVKDSDKPEVDLTWMQYAEATPV
jgi:hypothetical protein